MRLRGLLVMISSFIVVAIAVCPEPEARCEEDPHAIVAMVKQGNVTAYRFCDGTKVIKTASGGMSVQVSNSMGEASRKYTAKETARLEIARNNESVLHTAATQAELAAAEAAYQKRSQAFFKAKWSAKQYEAAISKCR